MGRDDPTLTYALEFADDRHDGRCFSKDGLPVVQAFKVVGHPWTECILCNFSHGMRRACTT